MKLQSSWMVFVISGGVACKSDVPTEESPTFHGAVAPILSQRCGACHTEGGMNSDTLFEDSSTASTLAPIIAGVVSTGTMPPFHAEETELCPNPWGWKNDPRLSFEEEQLIQAWADAGGPEGDPETAVPVAEPMSTELADIDRTVFPVTPWTTSVVDEVEDEFICFSIDPGLDEQKWLEAFQVVPESLEVVHHVLVGIDPSGESETLAGEDGVYECFGGFGVDATFIGGWIPGSSPIEMPEQSALRITEDARIVIQMHYHLAAQPYTDATGLALRWADSTPVREAYFELVGNANAQQPDGTGLQPGPNDEEEATFYIPPGASDHTETMALQIFDVFPRSTHVFLVANHMHYVGTDMRMWVERGSEAPESDEACLLHTPQWDFDWQQFYQYDLETQGGPEIYPDDTLWLECHYDNTLDNPGVASALSEAGEDAPLAVTLGEGSLDEMCIGVLGQVIDVEMEVENPTHEGELSALVTSEGYGFELTACEGPASVEVDAAGALYGRAACGLDALGMLITLEFEFNGSMDIAQGGEGSGPILMEVIGLDGAIEGTWEGEVIEDGLQVGFSLTGDLGGPEVSLEAELWLPLVESF